MANVIEAVGIEKRYAGSSGEVVLSGASLNLAAGECIALLGNSGSGKSTFLNCLGLLDRPDSGQLQILGQDALKMTERDRARYRLENIGFVFQFHHLIPELTVEENVALPATLLGKGRGTRAAELLESVGLADKRGRHPWQLSGGEQQRVALARALMNSPRILLTDEVTGNLDRKKAIEILELLLKMSQDLKMTLLSVTHDEELASRYKRQYRLKDGRIWDLTRGS